MERAYSHDVTQKIELPAIVFALKLKSPAWHTSTNQGSINHAIKQIHIFLSFPEQTHITKVGFINCLPDGRVNRT